jgi:hypothetical protein
LAGFLGLCGFRTLAGLILSGLSTLSGGSGLKYTRQPGLSWDCCLTMQAVTRLTSGISALHNRNAALVFGKFSPAPTKARHATDNLSQAGKTLDLDQRGCPISMS